MLFAMPPEGQVTPMIALAAERQEKCPSHLAASTMLAVLTGIGLKRSV